MHMPTVPSLPVKNRNKVQNNSGPDSPHHRLEIPSNKFCVRNQPTRPDIRKDEKTHVTGDYIQCRVQFLSRLVTYCCECKSFNIFIVMYILTYLLITAIYLKVLHEDKH